MGTELDTMAQTDAQIVEVVTAALDYAVELSEEEEGWKEELYLPGTLSTDHQETFWRCEGDVPARGEGLCSCCAWSWLPEGSTCSWRAWQEQVHLVDGLRLQRVHPHQCYRDCHACCSDADDPVHC